MRRSWHQISICFCISLAILSVLTETAHGDSIDGSGETVVVIDSTGVDLSHSELSDHIVEEVCVADLNLCPNGSGLQIGKGAAAPLFNSDGSFKDSSGTHGTEVASVAVGKTVGIAPGANIIAIHDPLGFYVAFKWVVDHAQQYKIASVVLAAGQNRSDNKRGQLPCNQTAAYGTNEQPLYLDPLIAQLRSVGIATVIASGNESERVNLSWPACIPGVVSVGSVPKGTLQIDASSNSSSELSLLAPDDVRAATVGPSGVHGFDDHVWGTSVAAPYVAGAIAILKAKYPTLTVDEEIAVLRTTGNPIDDETIKQIPSINLGAALAFLASGAIIPSLTSTFKAQAASGISINPADSTDLINSMTNNIAGLKSQLQSLQDSDALTSVQISALRKENESLTAKIANAVKPIPTTLTPVSTITCIKGRTIWRISMSNPKCPLGFKKK